MAVVGMLGFGGGPARRSLGSVRQRTHRLRGFDEAGGVSVNRIASWSGGSWSALGSGANQQVHSLIVYDEELIAGGDFSIAGNKVSACLATWTGTHTPGCEGPDDFDLDWYGDSCDNCPIVYNLLQEDTDSDGVGDSCILTGQVPPFPGFPVPLGDFITLIFWDAMLPGDLELTMTTDGPPVGSFTIAYTDMSVYSNVTTTAMFMGMIEITLSYDDAGMTAAEEAALTFQHHDGMDWIDIGSTLDTAANTITGMVSSLSPFVLALPESGSCCTICGDVNHSGELRLD